MQKTNMNTLFKIILRMCCALTFLNGIDHDTPFNHERGIYNIILLWFLQLFACIYIVSLNTSYMDVEWKNSSVETIIYG